ncbi:MAG: flagellar motor switch protein FliG [Sphingomonadaceae bacterium]|nr:flagellar motor switch protein FliG [Sphingomonadaceae bacterium]
MSELDDGVENAVTQPAPEPVCGPDQAAVMVMLLEDEDASALLGRLTPEELRLLGSRMCALGEIEPQAIAMAIAGFAEKADRLGLTAHDRVGRVHRMMAGAVGTVKADSLMRRIAPDDGEQNSALELARWLEPDVILPLIEGEHPQAIAVLLVQLDPEVAAMVLSGLPEHTQPQVVHRIATLGPVSADAVEMLEEALSTRIAQLHGRRPLEIGGLQEAADIINNSSRALGKRIVPEISKIDKKLAKDIEAELFKFEHLFELDPQQMGALLREVESETLIDALKGTEDEHREVFFRAMSSRAADGVKDEIDARGRLKKADVEAAQKEIVAIAKRLAADGTLVLGGGDEDYV